MLRKYAGYRVAYYKQELATFVKITKTMGIDEFKTLTLAEKLSELKYNGNLLGSYERTSEQGSKVPGDIYELYDFWVYLSEDEKTVVPSRRNPLQVSQ